MTGMPLPFRPNCQPTSLGPLPHTDAAAAWDLVLRHTPNLPALPLLAGRQESPFAVGYEAFPGVRHSNEHVFVSREDVARNLDRLYAMYLRGPGAPQSIELAALPKGPTGEQSPYRRARVLFGLAPGPVSLSLALVDEQDEPIANDSELVDAIAKHLFLQRSWLQKTLERTGKPVIIWLYEPYFSVVVSPWSPQTVETWFNAIDQALGNGPQRALWFADLGALTAFLDHLSLDLAGGPLPEPEQATTLAPIVERLLARKTAIAWGVVPVTAEGLTRTTVGRLAARFEAWVEALAAAGIPSMDVLSASLIMPEDSLAYLEPAEAERALALTAELASVLRHSYGVD